jgi:hypothetical protein
MTKRPAADAALVAAATAFDEQLTEYARLAELLLRTPLATVKHLERANQTIEEIGATETRLGETGRALALAISEARDRQQQLAEQMVAHLPSVQARNQALRDLITDLQQLAETVRAINSAASGGAGALDLEERVTQLAAAAETLAARARSDGFEEPATQAHALHQQMLAVQRKLRSVTSRQS